MKLTKTQLSLCTIAIVAFFLLPCAPLLVARPVVEPQPPCSDGDWQCFRAEAALMRLRTEALLDLVVAQRKRLCSIELCIRTTPSGCSILSGPPPIQPEHGVCDGPVPLAFEVDR